MRVILSGLLHLGLVLMVLVLLLAAVLCFAWFHRSRPEQIRAYETTNPHITGRTQVSAHRSGAGVMPEESMKALRWCAENEAFTPDCFEFDLHITRDGVLVLLHDDTLDRTADVEEVFGRTGIRAEEWDYADLRRLNIGAKFVSDAGESPYRDLHGEAVPDDLRIVALTDALDYLETVRPFSYIIEMKNGGELGIRAADLLYRALAERNLLDRAVFGSFHGEVSDYVDARYPDLMRGAHASEVLSFFLAALTNKKDYTPPCRLLQIPFNIPKECHYVNLGTAMLINYAHAHDMAVQYWTVNDERDMRYLLSLGADCIMSDYPDRLWRVREEMGK